VNRSPWAVFAAVALGTFMATLDSSIVNVALPTLAHTFGATVTQIEWVSLSYVLTITGLLLPFGRLGDSLGRRRVFLAGLALFTLGSGACALSFSTGTLVAARLLQGIGASMLSANSVALITAAFPREIRGRALGMVGAVVGLGLTVGPPIGGLMLTHFGWPSIFLINLPIGVFGVLLGRSVLPREPRADHAAAGAAAPGGVSGAARPPFDTVGALLSLVFLIGLTLALSRGTAWGWTSPATLACGLGAFAALALFIMVERRAAEPLVDFAFFADAAFRVPMLSLFASFVALFAAVFLVPFYLQRTAGMEPAAVGRVLVTVPLLLLLVSPVSGVLSDRLGSRTLSLAGLSATSLGLALLAWLLGNASERPLGVLPIIGGLFVVGLGQGLFQPPNSSSAMSSVPFERLGLASGLLATMRNLGTLFGIGLAAAVYEGRELVYARAHTAVAAAGLGMRDAFLAAALVAGSAALMVAFAPRTAHPSPPGA
jgi:EmrB/QacA subfamily drug resistance transporter